MNPPRVRVGTTYLLAAQGIFLVSGYIMHVVLGRYLGPVEYGLFGVVLYAATMIRTFVASGLPMAVARFVSSQPENSEAIYRQALLMQLALAFSVSLLFFITAPQLAQLLDDEALIPLFRMAAPIPIFFGLFFIIIQYYNGRRDYIKQSGWLAVSYVLRVAFVIGLAVAGWRVFGAVAGLVVATAIAGIAAFAARRPERKQGAFNASRLIDFSLPLIIASIAQALLTDMDLMFVKRLVADTASAGYYTSAKAMAQVTPFAFYALSSALYPAVSGAFSSGDMISLKRYIQQANKLLLIVILPLFFLVSLNSKSIITLFFGVEYLPGWPALCWLMASFSFLAILIIHKTVITGCGYPKVSSILTLTMLPLAIGLQLWLISSFGFVGAAAAATITFFGGSCFSTIILFIKFKAGFHLASTLRIVIAAGSMLVLDMILTKIGLPFLLKFPILVAIYLIALRLAGEWNGGQLKEFVGNFVSSGETA